MYLTPYRYVARFTLAHLHPPRYIADVMSTTPNANTDAQLSWPTAAECSHYHDARRSPALRAMRDTTPKPVREPVSTRLSVIGRGRGWVMKRNARVRAKLQLQRDVKVEVSHLVAAGEIDAAGEDAATCGEPASADADVTPARADSERTPPADDHSPPPASRERVLDTCESPGPDAQDPT